MKGVAFILAFAVALIAADRTIAGIVQCERLGCPGMSTEAAQ